MKMKCSVEEMKAYVQRTGIKGDWTEPTAGQLQFRAHSDGIMNWWPKTGTIQFQGPQEARTKLEQQVTAAIDGQAPATLTDVRSTKGTQPRIFVVHGHDSVAREQLELVLHRLGLNPFVLMNSAGGGKTIIEALEQHIGKQGEADFGIVLMTPDDVGYAKKDGDKEAKPRARQNVILEMGMLLSSLTRDRVAILVKGFIEQPSDAQGVIYLHFNEHVKEVVPKLAERLQACGITVGADQIARASM